MGGIFGGGSNTTVKQSTKAETTVDVDVSLENFINFDTLAEALENSLGKFSDSTDKLREFFSASEDRDIKTRQAEIILMLNGQAIEQNKAESEKQKVNTLKRAGNMVLAGTAIYLIYKGIKK
jgi:hypothetical protein